MTPGIAIVGMACRYPDARNPVELWENVVAGRRSFRPLPAERLNPADYVSADRGEPDVTYAAQAAVIEGYEFDRQRFRVSRNTYRQVDLTHWLALDVATQALADAGFPDGKGLPHDATGVLVGNSLTGEFSRANLMRLRWPYVRRVVDAVLAGRDWSADDRADLLNQLQKEYKSPFPPVGDETLAGGLSNTIAGRICNYYDLHGGGFTVDGACASSLLSVANACMALNEGDVDIMLAGGVDLSVDPFELVGFAKVGALAEHEMRVFDKRSAGFWPGEGCGFVVLMRAADAQQQNRRVYATIRGWGISSDGSGGITRPEVYGQQLALRRAYRRAGFGAETVSYFEGHGTGTTIGDATELRTLSEFRGLSGSDIPPAVVGSIKANIGHTKAAAGVAGLIKTTMALYEQAVPPNTGVREPHPELQTERPALTVARETHPWPTDQPLRAAVSAMGFGGINAHVVLEHETDRRHAALTGRHRWLTGSSQDTELLLISARDRSDLRQQIQHLASFAGRLSRAEVGDLAAELSRSLCRGTVRAALVASCAEELANGLEQLGAWLDADFESELDAEAGVFLGTGTSVPSVGFLFPGQGSPSHLQGGCWRYRFEEVGRLYADSQLPRHGDAVATEIAQPAIMTATLAGLRILDRLSIRANVAVGHSLGELAAYHWAGAYNEADFLRLAAARGKAVSEYGGFGGAMASIAAASEIVEGMVDSETVVIAGLNSLTQTVISGEASAVEQCVSEAQAMGLRAVLLPVSHAFHSPLMDKVGQPLHELLISLSLSPLQRTVVSTISGQVLDTDEDLGALMIQQSTSPVRFIEAFERASTDVDLWIEVGPGNVIQRLAQQLSDTPAVSVNASGDTLQDLLRTVGVAFVLGVPVEPRMLFEERFTRPFDLQWEPRFFVNPCELAPTEDTAVRDSLERHEAKDDAVVDQGHPEHQGITTDLSTVDMIRHIAARRVELPTDAVRDDDRLLGDLHLSSIAVGQLVAEAARAKGLAPPAAATEYANATVAELAAALDELPQHEATGQPERTVEFPPGVDSWVAAFCTDWVERPLPAHRVPASNGDWQLIRLPDDPFGHEIEQSLAKSETGSGVVVCLPPERDEGHVGLFLRAVRAIDTAGQPEKRLVLIDRGWGGASLARTFQLERPDVTTCVVHVPDNSTGAVDYVLAEIQSAAGYTEAAYDSEGTRRIPVLRSMGEVPRTEMPLGPKDVLLVSGGGKGIGAECGLMMAREKGVRLALLGRSVPERDEELAKNLQRMTDVGAEVLYLSADVTDPAAVSTAISRVTDEWGPITGVLHAAGSNVPKLLSSLDATDFRRTLAPKLDGLRNVLTAVDPERLALLVTFGSIIARSGMPGEADYALANAWLTSLAEEFQEAHPHCRCLAVEWSVWSGVGMGERLGRIEALKQQGITPISPDDGVQFLKHLLCHRLPSVAVVATGRFGNPPTVSIETPELPLLRFLERPRVYVPGVELVAECELSADTDPYLADHTYQNVPLFPAVLGLEAMAQATFAVAGQTEWSAIEFEDVVFDRPIAVPKAEKETVRLAALRRDSDRVELVLRTSESGFHTDHFRAFCRVRTIPQPDEVSPKLLDMLEKTSNGARRRPDGSELLPLDPDGSLYGSILFHRGRFRRVVGYQHLRATECVAQLDGGPDSPWFGNYLPQQCLLGDPSVRDATIHAIQACIPHATILPIGVERILIPRHDQDDQYTVCAVQRSQEGETLVYDVEVFGRDRRLRESWTGLRLRRVGQLPPPRFWAEPLVGPYIERRVQELVQGSLSNVLVVPNGKPGAYRDSDAVIMSVLGQPAQVHRRPDGKPVAVCEQDLEVSISHDRQLTMAIAGKGRVACDVESVVERPPDCWADLLGCEKAALAKFISAQTDEDLHASATRIWAGIECFKKSGSLAEVPFIFDKTTDDGWVILRAGPTSIATWVGSVCTEDQRVTCSVLVTDNHRR